MIEFKDMPAHSRVWIYQANRELTSSETNSIKRNAEAFVMQWTSHDQLMKASIEVFHNWFIVVCVDEKTAPVSGCGIDKSVKFIQQLEKDFSVSLMDRMNVAYRNPSPTLPEGKGEIHTCHVSELKNLFSFPLGEGRDGAIVFNNLVQTKDELEKNWEVPLKESWHKEFI